MAEDLAQPVPPNGDTDEIFGTAKDHAILLEEAAVDVDPAGSAVEGDAVVGAAAT